MLGCTAPRRNFCPGSLLSSLPPPHWLPQWLSLFPASHPGSWAPGQEVVVKAGMERRMSESNSAPPTLEDLPPGTPCCNGPHSSFRPHPPSLGPVRWEQVLSLLPVPLPLTSAPHPELPSCPAPSGPLQLLPLGQMNITNGLESEEAGISRTPVRNL